MVQTLHIQLIGGFGLTQGDQPVAALKGRLPSLLAYLLLQGDKPHPRQRLACVFWPDADESQARAYLRQDLMRLRRTLPQADQFLLVDNKTLQWNFQAPFTVDVSEFERALLKADACQETDDGMATRHALEQVVRLYQGKLLPDCHDEWLDLERERLHQKGLDALERLVQVLAGQQEYRLAIQSAQQLLQLDPLHEAGYCQLMRLQALAGNRAAAIQTYHHCMDVLREELGVSPSAATRHAYEHLLLEKNSQTVADQEVTEGENDDKQKLSLLTVFQPETGQSSDSDPQLQHLPLVGRDREWSMIQAWLTSALNQTSPQLLLLMGEPGIGKTRLLEELGIILQADGVDILWGRGFESEMMRPYGAWIDAMRATQHVDNLSPELKALLQGESQTSLVDRSRLFDAVVTWLVQLNRPIAIVLDDIQWLDEASTALLHYVARVLNRSVWFACAARCREIEDNLPVHKFVQAIRRENRLQTIDLKPLDVNHTAQLANTITAHIDVHQVFAGSGGNPLFILEIVRGQEGTDQSTLAALIQERLSHLSTTAGELVPWAAALGRSFNPETMANITDYPLPQLLTAMEELEKHSIIRPSSSLAGHDGYDFAHDVVRQVAYQQLSPPRRRLVHLHIAQVLNERAVDGDAIAQALTCQFATDVAYHAALGGEHSLTATASLTAAERCLRLFAYTEAAELARQGIHHCQYLDPISRIRLHLGLLQVYVMTGVSKAEAPVFEADLTKLVQEARALGLREEETSGLDSLVTLKFDHEDLTSVQELSLQAVETGRAASPQTMARTLARMGACLAEIELEMPRAEAVLLEAQSLADRMGLELAHINFGLGCVYRYKAAYETARQLLQKALNSYQQEQNHWNECLCLTRMIMLELEADAPEAALVWTDQLTKVTQQMDGVGSERQVAAAFDALIQYRLAGTHLEKAQATALNTSLNTLRRLDSQRMLTYLLTWAAETDLQAERWKLGMDRAEEALQLARVLNYPSEVTLAQAVLIKGALSTEQQSTAYQTFQTLRTNMQGTVLSGRAQATIRILEAQLQSLSNPNLST